MRVNRVNIITGSTRGLLLDLEVVKAYMPKRLATDCVKTRRRDSSHLRKWRKLAPKARRILEEGQLRKWLQRFLLGPYPLTIFIESVFRDWLGLARRNVLIPNPEWLFWETPKNLELCDEIWCKTRHSLDAFRTAGFPAKYLGFTTIDRLQPGEAKDYGRFLHVGGSHAHSQKGTLPLLRLWSQRPQWPQLLAVTDLAEAKEHEGGNLKVINRLPEVELRYLQNRIGVHICPSEVEGFGHSIAEAMSVAAVVITTDAPPMNELVSSDSGILVEYDDSESQGLGRRFSVSLDSLEAAIEKVIAMNAAGKKEVGRKARARLLQRSREFETNFNKLLASSL